MHLDIEVLVQHITKEQRKEWCGTRFESVEGQVTPLVQPSKQVFYGFTACV